MVTSGPTCEPLDQVRCLTNRSTGRTGTLLANHLAGLGAEVVHLYSASSSWSGPRLSRRCLPFGTADDLLGLFQSLDPEEVRAVFHAAAVGDFRFVRIGDRPSGQGKIASRQGILRAELAPTAKILPQLRGLFPRAWLVGWKYEVEGDRRSAVERARRQLEECATDLSVANGPAYGEGCALVGPGGEEIHLPEGRDLRMALASRLLDPG